MNKTLFSIALISSLFALCAARGAHTVALRQSKSFSSLSSLGEPSSFSREPSTRNLRNSVDLPHRLCGGSIGFEIGEMESSIALELAHKQPTSTASTRKFKPKLSRTVDI
mmetsp:Transcript_6593/g.13283  ORF Transcript_6593/g.13283 Transcript_6593/m.13283 type:complete len:110 (+) Transcript_6593:116-445(+)